MKFKYNFVRRNAGVETTCRTSKDRETQRKDANRFKLDEDTDQGKAFVSMEMSLGDP
jgi:hypothetical protein